MGASLLRAPPADIGDAPLTGTLNRELRRSCERLEHDAVALRELDQLRDTRGLGIGVEVEAHADRAEADGRLAATPSVPRKSRSPSACTVPSTAISSAVATARSVTPAQAASASSSMSPEHSSVPSPPVAGCSPAAAIARPVSTLHVTPSPSVACAFRVTTAGLRVVAVAVLQGRLDGAQLVRV